MQAKDFVSWLGAYLAANTEKILTVEQFGAVYQQAMPVILTASDSLIGKKTDAFVTHVRYITGGQLLGSDLDYLLPPFEPNDYDCSSAEPATNILRASTTRIVKLLEADAAAAAALKSKLQNGIPTTRKLQPKHIAFKKPGSGK